MGSKSSDILVGAFVLTLSVGLVWGILWISSGGQPQDFDRYLVYMSESVSGLYVDAPLDYQGVEVGKVEQISIDQKNPQRVRLLLQVRKGTPITQDSVAQLEYQGLTGIATVNLIGAPPGSAPLVNTPGEDYPVIKSLPSLYNRVSESAIDLLADLSATSNSLNELLSADNRENIARSIANIATTTDAFAQQSHQLESIVKNLRATLEGTQSASTEFPEMIHQITLSAEAVARMADEIRVVGEHLDTASTSFAQSMETSATNITSFTSTTLPDVSDLVSELKVASENLRRASETLAENPSALLFGGPPPKRGPGE